MTAIAKTGQDGATRSVVGHCLDVAHCAHAMLTTGVARTRLETLAGFPLTDVHVARLAVTAGAHDFGKCCVGFQNKITGGTPDSGHVAEAIVALARVPAVRAALGPIIAWYARPAEMLHAVIAHHGEPVSTRRTDACIGDLTWQWTAIASYDPIAEVRALMDALLTRFPAAMGTATPFPASPAFEHAVAGLVMTADWMGSDKHWHPVIGPEDRGGQAQALLDATLWAGWVEEPGTGDILGGRVPRDLQTQLAQHPLDQLVIAEAPTGEGKTEAALMWEERLAQAGLVDGMYFAVPTRSAANELHARVARALGAAYPRLRGHIVRAVPGLVATDPRDPTLPPTWALGSTRRVMGAPIAVGTIDQAMLSTVRVRHAWLRGWCLTRQLLVIDEVHASDAYMAEIIGALLDAHIAAGGYALLLSATLGEALAARLTHRRRLPLAEAITRPYPALSSATASVAVTASRQKSVRPQILPLVDCMQHAIDRAQLGETVLWIRSTVRDAVADVQQFRALGVPTLLHHSRYADVDRQYLDRQVLDVIGVNGTRRGLVIVATQTCEQSLDIDADLLVTDAVPADVMLQRMGRVGRHRPGMIADVLFIDPAAWDRYVSAKGLSRGTDEQGWAWVYDALPVRASLDWLRGRALVTVPDDARAWVESATHPDALSAAAATYGPAWIASWQASYGRDARDRAKAEAGVIDRARHYHLAIVDERIPTRLGEMSADVPVEGAPLVSPFGMGKIKVLPVPLRWLLAAGAQPDATARVVATDAAGTEIVVGGVLQLRYDRDGAQRVV